MGFRFVLLLYLIGMLRVCSPPRARTPPFYRTPRTLESLGLREAVETAGSRRWQPQGAWALLAPRRKTGSGQRTCAIREPGALVPCVPRTACGCVSNLDLDPCLCLAKQALPLWGSNWQMTQGGGPHLLQDLRLSVKEELFTLCCYQDTDPTVLLQPRLLSWATL